jgi:cell division septation protein DedD
MAEPLEEDSLEPAPTERERRLPVEEAPPIAPLLPESDAQSDDEARVEERPSYPYSLYLGSYRTVGQADRVAQTIQEKGFSAYRVKVNLREMGTWYRVFAGCFQTVEEATSAKRALDFHKVEIKKTAYSNVVGIYDNPKALEAAKARLVSAGYSPYAIKEKDGLAWLHAGAFYTKVGAQRLNRELKEDGIASETVVR